MRVPTTVRALSLIPMLVLGACSGTEPSAALLPAGAQQVTAPAEYFRRYAAGVRPVARRKSRRKKVGSSYPTSYPMSSTTAAPSSSRRRARSTRKA